MSLIRFRENLPQWKFSRLNRNDEQSQPAACRCPCVTHRVQITCKSRNQHAASSSCSFALSRSDLRVNCCIRCKPRVVRSRTQSIVCGAFTNNAPHINVHCSEGVLQYFARLCIFEFVFMITIAWWNAIYSSGCTSTQVQPARG